MESECPGWLYKSRRKSGGGKQDNLKRLGFSLVALCRCPGVTWAGGSYEGNRGPICH